MAYNLNRTTSTFIPEWNNNQESKEPIEIEFNPLNIDDYCEVLDISVKSRENTESSKNKKGKEVLKIKDFSVQGKITIRLIPIFKNNIVKISNLTINDQPVKPEEIVRSPELMELSSEIMNEMIAHAVVSEDDKKN